MGRDLWSGSIARPKTMNGWSYVGGNPINLTDSSGLFPSHCKKLGSGSTKMDYVKCVIKEYSPDIKRGLVQSFWYEHQHEDLNADFKNAMDEIVDYGGGCYAGPVPYRAKGYAEGISGAGGVFASVTGGEEIVYDFAYMERQGFKYAGAGIMDTAGVAGTQYASLILGFRSWQGLSSDYSGFFGALQVGPSIGAIIPGSVGTSIAGFAGIPDDSIHGFAWSLGLGIGVDPIGNPIGDGIDASFAMVWYSVNSAAIPYYEEMTNEVQRSVNGTNLLSDIALGVDSPWRIYHIEPLPNERYPITPIRELSNTVLRLHRDLSRSYGQALAAKYVRIYNEIHFDSYP